MASTNTFTKRNIYAALAILVDNGTINTPITVKEGTDSTRIVITPDNIKAFAISEVALLDNRNKKRADKPTAAEIANAELIPQIVAAFEPTRIFSAQEVADKFNISLGKAASVLSRNPSVFNKIEKGCKGKSGKVNGYQVIAND